MCQQSFDDEDYVDEDEEGSAESVLIGAACDLVSALCETLGDNFSSYFDVFMPLISSYYVSIHVAYFLVFLTKRKLKDVL